jgi:hypothetical protein
MQFTITASAVRDHMVLPSSPSRNAPLYLGQPLELKEEIEVALPEDWELTPFQHRIHSYGVDFISSFRMDGRTARYGLEYRVNSDQVAVSDAAAFYAQQQDISKQLGYNFTWTPNVQGPGPSLRAISWGFVLILFLAAIAGAVALDRYDPPADPAFPPRPHQGIGGFLFLPAIGICIGPFVRVYQMLDDQAAMFKLPGILHMAYPEQGWGVVAYGVFAQVYNIGMLAFSVLIVLLFFRRRTSLPLLIKIFYLAIAVGLMLDSFLYALLGLEQLSGLAYPAKGLFQAIVAAAIWVPVFHFSERVKWTFTVRRTRSDDPFPTTAGPMGPPADAGVTAPDLHL